MSVLPASFQENQFLRPLSSSLMRGKQGGRSHTFPLCQSNSNYSGSFLTAHPNSGNSMLSTWPLRKKMVLSPYFLAACILLTNLLPWLARSDSNLIQGMTAPLFVQHVRSHTLPPTAHLALHPRKIPWASKEFSLMDPCQPKRITIWFHHIPSNQLHWVIKTCNSCALLISTPVIIEMGVNFEDSRSTMSCDRLMSPTYPNLGNKNMCYNRHLLSLHMDLCLNGRTLYKNFMGLPQKVKTSYSPPSPAFTIKPVLHGKLPTI